MAEISFAVQQADADERQAEFAGAFQMVAGQDAQAAGIHWDAFVDTELGGEIRDADGRTTGSISGRSAIRLAKPGLAFQIAIQLRRHAVQVGEETLVLGQFDESLLRRGPEQSHRAIVERFEQVGIDAPEKCNCVGVPTPPQIVGQFMERL